MSNQHNLEHLLVSELRKRGALEDVICEYEIESVRECSHCRRLMNEGWMYEGYKTYCSDECLMAAHPEVKLAELKHRAAKEHTETYWTAWEG